MEAELLYKKIEGILTPEEADEVETWLASSPDHLAFFERLKTHYHERNDFVVPPDVISGYRESFDQILAQKFRQRRWWNSSAVLIAASLLILIGVAFAYFANSFNLAEPAQQPIAEVVIPLPEQETDSVPLYTEKKTNRKIRLSIGSKATYGLSEIYENHVEDVEYDVQNGIVSYNEPSKRKPAEQHRLETAPGAELCLKLEDGTVIWLNSGTEIEYPSYFEDAERRVILRGEAYFEVSKDSIRPFIVSTGDMDVKVYGTQFNVNTRRNNMTTTTLVEGSVAIIPVESGAETLLTPGETGKFDTATGKLDIREEDIDLYIGWRQGAYHFSDNSLESLFDEISLWYGIDVTFADNRVKNESFSGIISRDMPLMDLLNILTMTNYVKFDLKGNKLTVKENK